ncbi:MAG: hypothetical protein WAQ98_06095 [Blastocatellia bacterium]
MIKTNGIYRASGECLRFYEDNTVISANSSIDQISLSKWFGRSPVGWSQGIGKYSIENDVISISLSYRSNITEYSCRIKKEGKHLRRRFDKRYIVYSFSELKDLDKVNLEMLNINPQDYNFDEADKAIYEDEKEWIKFATIKNYHCKECNKLIWSEDKDTYFLYGVCDKCNDEYVRNNPW